MLKIYGLAPYRSVRVLWLAEEMGLRYEKIAVDRWAPDASFLALNPLGTLPAIVDGETQMIESVAIMHYLLRRYGPSPLNVGPSEPGFAAFLQFMAFGEAGLTAAITPLTAARFIGPESERDNWLARNSGDIYLKRVAFVDAQLARTPYLVGERFTAADISVAYALGIAKGGGLEEALPPGVMAYRTRLFDRPAYKRACAA